MGLYDKGSSIENLWVTGHTHLHHCTCHNPTLLTVDTVGQESGLSYPEHLDQCLKDAPHILADLNLARTLLGKNLSKTPFTSAKGMALSSLCLFFIFSGLLWALLPSLLLCCITRCRRNQGLAGVMTGQLEGSMKPSNDSWVK